MAIIMVLAETGFGKSTSLDGDEELGIKGLDPADTYVISATVKPLPGRGSTKRWPATRSATTFSTLADLKDYRRVITNQPDVAAHVMKLLWSVTNIHNVVVDDMNYFMQDMYMEKALSSGWDAPKMIGFQFNKIFKAMDEMPLDKNLIMMAHYEEYKKVDGRLGVRMKTTGNMVREYVTPEGKSDVLLFGTSIYDDKEQKSRKVFVTRDDGVHTSAKSHRIFGPDETYILNDLSYVVKKVDEYYLGV